MTQAEALQGLSILESALEHLRPRLSHTITPFAPVDMVFNSDDWAAMLLRDAICVCQSISDVSHAEMKRARQGRWRLKAQFREAGAR